MKLIALDVGTKRIGVAKADSSVRVAVPYSAVEVDGNEFNKLASLARAWDINCFVLGLPRNNEGAETKQSKYVRNFAEELKKAIPDAKICFQDESLTSVEAEKRLKKRKKGYKKGDIDSEAAAIILQDFMEEHANGKPTSKAAAAKRNSVKGSKPPRTHHLATALIIIFITLLAGCGAGYAYYTYSLQAVYADIECEDEDDLATDPCQPIEFLVQTGESTGDVALNLKNAGLIRNSVAFQIYYRLTYHTDDAAIKAGQYSLTKSMDVAEIAETLVTGTNDTNVFSLTILPGMTVREVKAELLKSGYTETDIDTALAADYSGADFAWIFEGKPADVGLEGYLFGDTYEFYRTDTPEAIIKRMLVEMAEVLQENGLPAKFAEHGLNLYQGITLASIVQKEANNPTDQARVAQVFYNRLANGMSLGSDVTAKYAADLADPNREIYTDNAAVVNIDSPYNTRRYPGLPYGAISNPGLAALLATATPDSDFAASYLFFLTGDDQMMYYSDTEAGHQQNIVNHCQELCNVAL